MARSTEARLKSAVGDTREAKISFLLSSGLAADSVISALEREYPECMDPSDPRRKKLKNPPPFDKLARQRMLEAVRSTRRLNRLEDEANAAMVELAGPARMASIDDTELSNIRRFSCGQDALDDIYGETHFIWTKDHNEKHPEKGRYQKGQYMPAWMPQSVVDRGYVDGEDLPTDKPWVCGYDDAFIEKGWPYAFQSIWPGAPGVGKSRLAISVTKDLNKLGHLVNYYNGEAEKSQFRTWCGTDVNPDLFMVSHVDAIELGQIVNDAYRFKPRVIFIDSLQMVAGADTQRGMMAILSRFKLLKNDPDAGKPHIVMISQLNKKGEMVGSRKIPHMVDFVGKAAKLEAQQGVFVFECPDKNRGGETGRGAIFKHLPNGIECLSKDHRRGPTWKLSQISSLAAQGQQLEEDDQDGPRPVGTGLAGA